MERELLSSNNSWKEIQEFLSLALMCLPVADGKEHELGQASLHAHA